MKRSRIVIVGIMAVLAGALYYFYAGSTTPAGQPALTRLDAGNFSELKNAFNSTKDSVRVIALLSPT